MGHSGTPAWLLPLCLLLAGCGVQQSASHGEQIYRFGEGREGRLAYREGPRWMIYGRFGCAACHGEDGRGRVVRAGSTTAAASGTAPPIHAAALARRGYDEALLRRAIVEGVGAEGRAMSYYMPRWELDAADLEALREYLGQL